MPDLRGIVALLMLDDDVREQVLAHDMQRVSETHCEQLFEMVPMMLMPAFVLLDLLLLICVPLPDASWSCCPDCAEGP